MILDSTKSRLAFLPALLALAGAGPAEAASARCDAAWAAYRDLKARSVMEEAQYPLTAEGAEVRAACGRTALPAPPGADINPVRPRVRHKRPAGPVSPGAVPAPMEPGSS